MDFPQGKLTEGVDYKFCEFRDRYGIQCPHVAWKDADGSLFPRCKKHIGKDIPRRVFKGHPFSGDSKDRI